MCIPSPSPESRFFSGFFCEGDFPAEGGGRATRRNRLGMSRIGPSLRITSGRNDRGQAVVPIRFSEPCRRDRDRERGSLSHGRQGSSGAARQRPVLQRQSSRFAGRRRAAGGSSCHGNCWRRCAPRPPHGSGLSYFAFMKSRYRKPKRPYQSRSSKCSASHWPSPRSATSRFSI